jgi:hypothetical protein
VAQVIEHLLSKCKSPEVKLQYYKKKKKIHVYCVPNTVPRALAM